MVRTVQVASLLLLCAAGCLRPDPHPRFTPAWEPFDPNTEGWFETDSVLVVADCQLHNLYSKALPERNLSAESVAATAIRSPQLDLFAGDVLAWILNHGAPGANAVVHLGDALDLACEGEWDQFLGIMEACGKPWFMAPGNHDFYYFGTYDPVQVSLWEDACHESGRYLTKDLFIRLYVGALLRQDDAGCIALAGALGLGEQRGQTPAELAPHLPEAFEWEAPAGAAGFLRRICWNLDTESPWRSFILQAIELRTPTEEVPFGARILLLDSCQYARRPGLIPNAWQSYPLVLNCGFSGQMLPDQLRKVRAWIEQERAAYGFTLACHHPFEALEPRTKTNLGWLWRELAISMMITGHTHQGFFAHHDLGGASDELELNLGSTTDWPMEWRVVTGHVNIASEEIYLRLDRHTLVDTLFHETGYFVRGWEVPQDAPDDYRKYKQGSAASGLLVDFYLAHHLVPYWLPPPDIRPNAAARETEEQVKDTLLWTYFRLLSYFPTAPDQPDVRWPSGLRTDRAVVDRILALSGKSRALEEKVVFLKQLNDLERTRRSVDPLTGEPNDDARARFKLSQAAWASRFESSQGRRLRVEDNLVRVDWERAMARRNAAIERQEEQQREPPK